MMRLPSLTTCAIFLAMTMPGMAATIWTDWTGATTGAPGAATGTLGGVTVSYSGELGGFVINGTSPIWNPASTYVGGTSTTSPSVVGDDLRLSGSTAGVRTISFSSAITNPLVAIWSLGAPGAQATMTFVETPTLEVGGPNSIFAGSSIAVNGNVISGLEGNGVVQFTGTFTSLSFTSTFENFYAFTVGLQDDGGGAGVPEPSSWMLLVMGLGSVAAARYRRRG